MPDIKQLAPPGIESKFVKPTSYTSDNTPKYFCTLRFQKYSRPGPFSHTVHYDEAKYILPLPQTINDTVIASWSGANLGVVGDIQNASFVGGAMSAIYGNLGNMLSGAAGMAISGARTSALAGAAAGDKKGIMDKFKMIGSAVDTVIPPENVQNAIESSVGIAPNPNPTLLFKGPELRTFNLRWIFYPKNETESITIHKMIRDIKRMMLPGTVLLDSAALLKYPYMCVINFYPWDSNDYAAKQGGSTTNPLLNHTTESIVLIKRCAVTNCSVNYSPGTTPSFFANTNKPTIIELNITLHELEYLLADDYGGEHGFFQSVGELLEAGAKNLSWLLGSDAVAAPPDKQPDQAGNTPK